MSGFIYLVAEGVTDVMLIQRVLRRYFHLKQVKTREELGRSAPGAEKWLDQFKWPHRGDISRHSVPAPVFFLRDDGLLVAIRNAQGLTRIGETIEVDGEAFSLIEWMPGALGVFIDADNKKPDDQFSAYRDGLQPHEAFPSLTGLRAPGQVVRDAKGRAAGIFVFPNQDDEGTLDHLLLALGAQAFPELHNRCEGYVEDWQRDNGTRPESKELQKPAGPAKAQLSMMAAILKPGRNINASLQDHDWVPKGDVPNLLVPLVTFLDALGLDDSESTDG